MRTPTPSQRGETASESIGRNLVSPIESQLLSEESEIGEEPIIWLAVLRGNQAQ